MKINIVCTSKPCDGLFYYSYEYCSYLNSIGVDCQVVVIAHKLFSHAAYVTAIKNKYIQWTNCLIYFNIKLILKYLLIKRLHNNLQYQNF